MYAVDDDAMQKLYRAAVGPNADFYVPKFLSFDQPGAARTSWNWPAFFFSFYWFLYRRMYGPWAIYCLLIPLALALVARVLAALQMPSWSLNLISLGYSFVVLPLFANYLYHGAIKRRIAGVQQKVADPSTQVTVLEAIPQTNRVALLVVIVLIVPVTGILAAIAIPAYQDYTVRARVSESLNRVADLKLTIAGQYAATHAWPAAGEQAQSSEPAMGSNAAVSVDNGTISIHFSASAPFQIANQTLSLRPSVAASGEVIWTCGYASDAGVDPATGGAAPNLTSMPERTLPRGCRR